MFEHTTRLDDCTLEHLAADERADALRNEAAEYERALFLSEASSAARREPTEAELQAEYRRQLLGQHASDLMRAINRHVPRVGGQWDTAIKALIRLSGELNVSPLLPPVKPSVRLPLIPGDSRPAA